jgi:hypothetical protein
MYVTLCAVDTVIIAKATSQDQGNQIGIIFVHWVIVYFGQIFENYKRSRHFWTTLSMYSVTN